MRKKLTFAGLLQAAATSLVVVSLLTAIGLRHYGVDLFTHFRLQYLLIGMLLLPLMLWFRAWATAALLAVSTVVSSVLILQWYAPQKEPSYGGRDLKILHANVQASNTEYQRLIDFVKQEDPDIVFLQEVNKNWSIAAHALRSDWHHGHVVSREGNFGIAVFSKLPFTTVSHVDSAPLDLATIVGSVEVDDKLLNFVSTHPMIPVRPGLYRARNQQLAEVASMVAEIRGPTLVTGDLNVSLWDPALTQFERDSGLINGRRGVGLLPTWPTFFPVAMIPIDHILTSPDVRVLHLRTGPDIGSDHLPLVATIRL